MHGKNRAETALVVVSRKTQGSGAHLLQFQGAVFVNEHFEMRKGITGGRFEGIQDKGVLQHGFHPDRSESK